MLQTGNAAVSQAEDKLAEGSRFTCPRLPPRAAHVFERLSVKLAIQGQREAHLLGQRRRASSASRFTAGAAGLHPVGRPH
jgi:hypothetical protein